MFHGENNTYKIKTAISHILIHCENDLQHLEEGKGLTEIQFLLIMCWFWVYLKTNKQKTVNSLLMKVARRYLDSSAEQEQAKTWQCSLPYCPANVPVPFKCRGFIFIELLKK